MSSIVSGASVMSENKKKKLDRDLHSKTGEEAQ